MIFLSKPYSRQEFKTFLEGFLPDDFELFREAKELPLDRADRITSAHSLGVSKSIGELSVFEIKHRSTKDPRVQLAKETFKIMADTSINKALVAYSADGTDNWRLSLITIELSLDKKRNRLSRDYSNPRRHSFFLGPGAKINTPTKYLAGQVNDFEDLQKRFALEVVNNEFYKEIAKLYDELVGADSISSALKHPGTEEEKHEFAVRLIGRIIFCWFLREKKSNSDVPLIPRHLLSRAASNTLNYYHEILAPLFFEVLNRPPEKRSPKFQANGFQKIPYLNGGLFSDDEIDNYKFDKGLEASFSGIVSVPDKWLRRLFDLLELYNFTVDENTSYDVDLSIDPEMLGRVFENLLARINPETGETVRKSTGSFYTPREIVDYMVDASLTEYLATKTKLERAKLEALVSYNSADDVGNELTDSEGREVLEALSTLTVLDPACGSGAFPIGMLQKIVYVISVLDPQAKWWLSKQLENASLELRKEFENKGVDYIRKLGIIRQTIFGVDIQPIATEISRLRCFLTLIVDESIDDDAWNRGIRPLPNLDFKFVTANSLVSLPRPEDKRGNVVEGQAVMFEETSHIEELRQIRNEYFNSTSHERHELRSRFERLQKQMVLTNVDVFRGSASKLYDTLSRWDPFGQRVSGWFDPEWMFGVDNFDIVIANPPYVDSETMVKAMPGMRNLYKASFDVAKGNWDLYIVFYGLALKILNESGIGCFISPNQWLTLQYGKALRDHLSTRIINFADMRAYADFSAGVNTFVTTFTKKGRSLESFVEYRLFSSDGQYSTNKMSVKGLSTLENYGALTSSHFEIISKLNKLRLRGSNLFHCGKSFIVNEYYLLADIITENPNPDSKTDFKLINTGLLTKDITKTNWGIKNLKHINQYLYPVVSKQQFYTMFPKKVTSQDTPKVIVSESSGVKVFVDEHGQYLADKVTIPVIPLNQQDVWMVGALLNSKLFHWYYCQVYSAGGMMGTTVNGSALESMPLPELSKLVELRELTKDRSSLSNGRADKLIYKAYNLTSEEIKIIESRSN